jgi:DNA (cytosine-5)-methyltransferase 1
MYNENDPGAVEWLSKLQSRGLIAKGDIDGRSIEELRGGDCGSTSHFFAGIGGWAYALQLAGWDPARPVWTGSCPCQPFSTSGAKRGFTDSKHLWPAWYELIKECRPAVIFGEQTASALGREWLSRVRADLEELGYAFGAADLCAAGVNAPHRRQRLYWVAHAGHLVCDEASGFRGAAPGFVGAAGADDGSVQYRRIGPGVLPVADGVPERVGRIRGYGNAIVPQLAAVFIRSFMEAAGYMPGVARSGWAIDIQPGEVVEIN